MFMHTLTAAKDIRIGYHIVIATEEGGMAVAEVRRVWIDPADGVEVTAIYREGGFDHVEVFTVPSDGQVTRVERTV